MFFFNLWAILGFSNTFGLGLKGLNIYELAASLKDDTTTIDRTA